MAKRQARPCSGRRSNGEPCGNYAMNGTSVCHAHGGKAPQVRAAAERRSQEAEAARAVATYGGPVDIDPAQALLEEVQRTAGAIAWLGKIIAASDPDDLVWGVVEETDTSGEHGSHTKKHRAGPSVWLDLYQKERRHLAVVAKAALDAGVSERIVRMYETVGSGFVQVIERVLDRLDLTAEQRAAIPGVLVEELQALPGGTA